MAYDANNLNVQSPRVGQGEGGANAGYSSAKFTYRDITANDNLAAMTTNGFITDGDDQGIRVGDEILFIEDTVAAEHRLVTAITAGAVDTVNIA